MADLFHCIEETQLCKATITQLKKKSGYLISHLVFTVIWKALKNSIRKLNETTGTKIGKRKKKFR